MVLSEGRLPLVGDGGGVWRGRDWFGHGRRLPDGLGVRGVEGGGVVVGLKSLSNVNHNLFALESLDDESEEPPELTEDLFFFMYMFTALLICFIFSLRAAFTLSSDEYSASFVNMW